jgi:small-conductance mechanosensitive channel
MHDTRILIALGCIAVAGILGVAAEYAVRRTQVLHAFRTITLGLFVVFGLYSAAIDFQGGHHIAPVTHRVFVALLIVFASIALARIAGAAVGRYGQRGQTPASISLFVSVTEIFVGVLGGLVVLDYLGISIAPILTAFGIGGLAVALALQDTLANFFAGIEIVASRQIHAGDYVALDAENRGTIVDINWRNTVIADADDNRIIVPNQKLASAIFTNYAMPLRTAVTLTVDRKSDLGKLAQMSRETAKAVARTSEVEVASVFDKVTDSSVELTVTIPVREPADRARVRSEFTKAFVQRIASESLEDGATTARRERRQGDG